MFLCCLNYKIFKNWKSSLCCLRCVRCQSPPLWSRHWRSWASGPTATSPSSTPTHQSSKHSASLWRGECQHCLWWMSRVWKKKSQILCIQILLHSWNYLFKTFLFVFLPFRKSCRYLFKIWCHCKYIVYLLYCWMWKTFYLYYGHSWYVCL